MLGDRGHDTNENDWTSLSHKKKGKKIFFLAGIKPMIPGIYSSPIPAELQEGSCRERALENLRWQCLTKDQNLHDMEENKLQKDHLVKPRIWVQYTRINAIKVSFWLDYKVIVKPRLNKKIVLYTRWHHHVAEERQRLLKLPMFTRCE